MALMEHVNRWLKVVLLGFPLLLAAAYLGVGWRILADVITPERMIPGQAPAELGFVKAEPLSFKSAYDQVPLKGWLVPSDGERAVVLVHGIHSHAWDCQAPDLVRAYTDAGFHVFLFDLRGHGASGGDQLGLGWKERGDVRAAADLLLARGFRPGKIGIHGTSYGAATAILAAATIPEIGALIADSSFADMLDVIPGEIQRQTGLGEGFAELLMPGIKFLALWFYCLDLDEAAPEQAIEDVPPRPILLIHGTGDPVIPVEHALRLKAAAGPQVELWLLPGLKHTEGVRLVPDCESVSPMREVFLHRVTNFFDERL